MTTWSARKQSGRSLWREGCVCAACIALGTAATNAQDFAEEDESLEGQVEVSEFLTVDIHVQDTDLAKVLQMLSIQSQKNIIVTKSVSGTVTAHLYDVTFYEALDSILNANGFGYVEEGNFIKVYTREELAAIEQAARELTHQRFELSYLNASDAAIFVTPLLSEDGSIAINGEAPDGFEADETEGGRDTWAFSATLIVSDYPEHVERIGALLNELDTRPKQVVVEATVLQTTLNEDNAWGIDWSIVGDINFSDFTNPLSGVDELLDGSVKPDDNKAWNTRSNTGRTDGPGTLKIGVVSDDISVFIRLLDEVTDTTIVSRPRVLTLNRQRGEILIGRRIGYLSSTATETSTTQTVQFLDTGTQLIFRPFVGKDGFIRMELKPSISEGVIREVTGSDGGSFTVPDEITQELTTNVVVRDGSTIVLGGLFKEETTLTRRQVPVLGDIPLIGAAFRGHEDNTDRSEITFLITPTIMNDEILLADGGEYLDAVEEARIGARKGVLPWSRDRLTSQHNMKAEELLRAGDTELALWHVNQSLNLNPNQPLVIRMREEITGESTEWFNGTMFDRMVEELSNGDMEELSQLNPFVPITVDPLAREFASKKSGSTGGAAPAGDKSDVAAGSGASDTADEGAVDETAAAEDEMFELFGDFQPEAGLGDMAADEQDPDAFDPSDLFGPSDNLSAGETNYGPTRGALGPVGRPVDEWDLDFAPDEVAKAGGDAPLAGNQGVVEGGANFKPGDEEYIATAPAIEPEPRDELRMSVSPDRPETTLWMTFDSRLRDGEMRFVSDPGYFDVDGNPYTPGTIVGRWHWFQEMYWDDKGAVEFVDVPTDEQ